MSRILVVEDEAAIRRGLCDLLAFHGHEPVGVARGDEGLREALEGSYDLLLLDVMLPEVDGLTICRQARAAKPHQAILMLTARGREEDVLEGFTAGCDDYVAKPFSVAQLMARVSALLRRADADSTLVLQGCTLDESDLRIRRDDVVVDLTIRDVEVLVFLHRHGGVARRNELLREVWGYERIEAVETRCVDMHLSKLRKKLSPLGVELIETVRGAGYRLRG